MRYAFADFELDEERWELRRNGQALEIAPKAFEIGLYLLKNRDRIVPKEGTSCRHLEGDFGQRSFAERNIFALRQLLGDDGGAFLVFAGRSEPVKVLPKGFPLFAASERPPRIS
jgi:DNA-binding winged helix-turn-helix (wHTH) protein